MEKKGKKKRGREWSVGCDWLLEPTISSYLRTCHWKSDFEWWKYVKLVFIFHDLIRFFEWWKLNIRWWKLIQTKQLAVGPTKFGYWVMKTEYWVMKTLKPNKSLARQHHCTGWNHCLHQNLCNMSTLCFGLRWYCGKTISEIKLLYIRCGNWVWLVGFEFCHKWVSV